MNNRRSDTNSVTLIRSRRIMRHNIAESTDGLACFATDESDTGYIPSRIFIHRTDLADMGNPWQITVTIEPGDLLNEDTP